MRFAKLLKQWIGAQDESGFNNAPRIQSHFQSEAEVRQYVDDQLTNGLPPNWSYRREHNRLEWRIEPHKRTDKIAGFADYVLEVSGDYRLFIIYYGNTDAGCCIRYLCRFHQEHSQKVMDELHQWMDQQLEQKRVEPNSGLGEAIQYMRTHWTALTLFLQKAGAPLDNNICERALKRAILHRKNSLGYKTQNGARPERQREARRPVELAACFGWDRGFVAFH